MNSAIQAEKMVLGAILAGAKDSEVAFDILKPEDFLDLRHQTIFRAMLRIREENKPRTITNLYDSLAGEGELDKAGEIAYVSALSDGVPHRLNIEADTKNVSDKSNLRRLAMICDSIGKEALDQIEEPAILADRAIQEISDLAMRIESGASIGMTYRDAAADCLASLDVQKNKPVFTDIPELDELTGGFRPGELIIFTAETGTGKTLLAQQTRRRSCEDGRHGLYCSGEMLARHLISREISVRANVPFYKMRRPEKVTPPEMGELMEQVLTECQACRILDGELTLVNIRRCARRMKKTSGLDLIVIDYDELVEVPGKDEWEQQKILARAAKSLGMELQCAVILISQLRKVLAGEDRLRPTIQRLYGSGAKAKHASCVIFVDREFVQELRGDETKARIVIVKNRDGRLGEINCTFNVRKMRFDGEPQNAGTLPYKD